MIAQPYQNETSYHSSPPLSHQLTGLEYHYDESVLRNYQNSNNSVRGHICQGHDTTYSHKIFLATAQNTEKGKAAPHPPFIGF